MALTSSVLQGYILGPTLWNIFYDGVLSCLVGYAEDLALVAAASEQALMRKSNHVISLVDAWLTEYKLDKVPEKGFGKGLDRFPKKRLVMCTNLKLSI